MQVGAEGNKTGPAGREAVFLRESHGPRGNMGVLFFSRFRRAGPAEASFSRGNYACVFFSPVRPSGLQEGNRFPTSKPEGGKTVYLRGNHGFFLSLVFDEHSFCVGLVPGLLGFPCAGRGSARTAPTPTEGKQCS